ncbi:hypothetical protein Tco_0509215 [Tanacetum coccineum]
MMKPPTQSQQPPRNCSKCGGPFGALYCRQCTCERCRRNYTDEVCALCCYEVEKSFVNDSNPNSFIDSPNNFNPPPQPQTYSCEFCGNNAHNGYDCPPQVSFIYNPEPCYNQDFDNDFLQSFDQYQPPQYTVIHQPPQETSLQARENLMKSIQAFLKKFNRISFRETPKDIQELLRKLLKDLQIISEELADYINTPNWNCPAFYDNDDKDDDEEYTIATTPVLPTVEPDNSLSMGDEHLSTIPEKKESSVEDLVPIQNHSEIFFDPNDDYASSDDDPLYSEDIDYVDASPPDSELVNLEVVMDFDTEDGEIDIDILLTMKDDILCEKLLNINLLIAKIEALKDNHTPSIDSVLKSPSLFPNSFLEETGIFDNSLPESDIFGFDMEEKSSGNPTSYSDLSFPDYEAFYYDNEPDLENFTIDVVEYIFDNPTRELYVHVPNVFPTPSHPLSGFGLRSF